MEKRVKLEASSGEQMDSSKLTEEKSDDVKEDMSSSVVKMLELNRKLAEFDMDRFQKETTETVESKTFLQSQKNIETTCLKEIEKVKSDIEAQLNKQDCSKENRQMLESTIETKETEIEQLTTENLEYKEKLQISNKMIDRLKISITNLDDRVKQLKNMYDIALEKQIEAEKKCACFEAEKKISEIKFQAEKELFNERVSSIKTTQKSIEETNITELEKKIQTVHTQRLEETKRSYEHQIKESKRETETLKRELKSLKQEHNKLKDAIFRYEDLLVKKMSTKTKQEKNIVTLLQSETRSEGISSKVDTYMASKSHKVSYNSPESDQMPEPITIKEFDAAGNFFVIHNSDKNEIDISNWMIERTFPKGEKTQFKIPKGIKISAEKDLKILSKSASDKKAPGDIIATCQTWGTGKGEMKVKNTNGKDIASYPIG